MMKTITSAVTQNVLGELRKAGIFSKESIQTENNPETSSQIETSASELLHAPVADSVPSSSQATQDATNGAEQLPAFLFTNNTNLQPDGLSTVRYKPLGRPLFT
jgi:hypothetical protein